VVKRTGWYSDRALKQYAGSTSGLPSFSEAYGWMAADLFLYALENAGCDAYQEDILTFMSTSDQYDTGGLLSGKQYFAKRDSPAGPKIDRLSVSISIRC